MNQYIFILLLLICVALVVIIFKCASIIGMLKDAERGRMILFDRLSLEVSCIKQGHCDHEHKLVSKSNGFVRVTCKRCKKLLYERESYEEVESYLNSIDEKECGYGR